MVTLDASRPEQLMEPDRLFAEFLESSWTEPAGDPVAVLADSGVHPHRWEEALGAAAVPVRCEVLDDLLIEDLDHPAPVVAAWTYCG